MEGTARRTRPEGYAATCPSNAMRREEARLRCGLFPARSSRKSRAESGSASRSEDLVNWISRAPFAGAPFIGGEGCRGYGNAAAISIDQIKAPHPSPRIKGAHLRDSSDRQKCHKLAPRGSKNPEQHLTKEQ